MMAFDLGQDFPTYHSFSVRIDRELTNLKSYQAWIAGKPDIDLALMEETAFTRVSKPVEREIILLTFAATTSLNDPVGSNILRYGQVARTLRQHDFVLGAVEDLFCLRDQFPQLDIDGDAIPSTPQRPIRVPMFYRLDGQAHTQVTDLSKGFPSWCRLIVSRSINAYTFHEAVM